MMVKMSLVISEKRTNLVSNAECVCTDCVWLTGVHTTTHLDLRGQTYEGRLSEYYSHGQD